MAISISTSVCQCVRKPPPIPAVLSQNVAIKSWLICINEWKVSILGHPLTPAGVYEVRKIQAKCITF